MTTTASIPAAARASFGSAPAGVRIERSGHVTTIIIDRPQQRNAVDGPTATALATAFRAFEIDDNAHVAVLYGANGVFCAGADCIAPLITFDDARCGQCRDQYAM